MRGHDDFGRVLIRFVSRCTVSGVQQTSSGRVVTSDFDPLRKSRPHRNNQDTIYNLSLVPSLASIAGGVGTLPSVDAARNLVFSPPRDGDGDLVWTTDIKKEQ